MDDLPNMNEEVANACAAANDDNSGPEENEEADSSSLSSLSARKRALQNPVILHNLFQLCPVSIVAPCRLVCKQWYDESLTTWRSAFPLIMGMRNEDIFIVHGDNFYYAGESVPRTFTPLKEFLEFCEKSESQCSTKPFRNIKIQECQFSLNSEDFELFWNVIGKNLTTLNLSECKFADIKEFRQIIYQRCPVLRRIEIYFCELLVQDASGGGEDNELEYKDPTYGEHKHLKTLSISYGESAGLPVSWMEILSHFSFLTSFQLSTVFAPELELETFMKVVKEIRKTDRMKLAFKRFQLHPLLAISQHTESHHKFTIVKELRLPLPDCIIEVHSKLDQRFLRNTLEYLASSVNSIIIRQEDHEDDQLHVPLWFRDFPFGIQMNNITTLNFVGDLCGSFIFLKYAPNLEELDITQDKLYGEVIQATLTTDAVFNTCKEELANVKMVRLTDLKLEFIVSNDDMGHLINWMPNIMDLEMILNDEQFKMVCQNWTNLRDLKVMGTGLLTEVGVTGLEKGKKAMEAGIHPNISKLEALEYLVLNIKLSPASVFHLFLHVPSLQDLSYVRSVSNHVYREDLDISAYQRAIQDGVVEQWIADNGNILGVDEQSDSN